MDSASSHRLGLILAGSAALCWSSAAVFTRLIGTDLMTMLFWRGLFSGAAVFLIYVFLERKSPLAGIRGMGWPGLAVAVLSATAMICGIGSFRLTSAADTMVIYATAPFIAAALAFVIFGERTRRSTILASAAALVGVIIMLSGSHWGGSLLGKLLAIFMTLAMAGFSVIMRQHRDLPMMPAMGLSAWLCSSVCFWFAAPLSVNGPDLLLTAAFGVFQNAAGLALYTLGTRRIAAAEATLLASLEVPFTPFWVWLFMNEIPGTATLIGGAVVLTALFSHILGEFRRSAPVSAAAQ